MAQEFIEILSPSALKELQTANVEILTLIKNIDNAGKSMQSIKTPSGSDSAVKNLNAKLLQQEKLYTDLQIKLEKYAQAQQQTAIKNNQLEASTIRLNKAKETSIKQLEREQAKLEASQQLYNKVQQKLNALSNEYKNLAVKKELSGKLTDAEAKRYDYLSGRITKYDSTLKAVDASMGKYQRNVGNYASAFNPLSNSINQLTREMPAFTYSVQTGFMALSNNIPIFTDAIGNAIKQNKELAAQGQPTTSVLKQLAGAFLSWGTALSVGITLLTVYGKEIGEFFKNISNAGAGIKSLEEQQSQLNNALKTGNANANEEIAKLDILYRKTTDVSLSINQRKKAVDELQTLYPHYFKNLKDETILNGQAEKSYLDVRDAILAKYMAEAIGQQMQENAQNRIKEEFQLIKDIAYLKEKIEKDYTKTYINEAGERVKVIDEYYGELSAANMKLQTIRTATKKDDDLLFKMQSQYLEKSKTLIIEETKSTKKSTDAKKENLEVTEKLNAESLNALEETINKLKESYRNTTIGSTQYGLLANQIKLLEGIYKGLTTATEEATTAKEEYTGIELSDEQVYAEYYAWLKLKEATDNYLKTLTSDAFNKAFDNIGLSSAKMFLDFDADGFSTFDKLMQGADTLQEKFAITFQAVGDVAQDVFNKISEMSNQRFQEQYANLEREKEIAIMFAGESSSAREEIERQYEQRQKEIKRREFQAKKQQAIFNIAIDTAQAIVASLKTDPTGVMAVIIGAIGAIQAGIVASQQMPQFWKGTENAPEGMAWTQEKGREIITDKSGKIKSLGSDKGATMTYLNKGDKVYTATETSQLMHNKALNSILTNNGIVPTRAIVNNNIDLQPIVNAINSKESFNINIDKDGLNNYVTNGHTTKEITNRRIKGQSYGI